MISLLTASEVQTKLADRFKAARLIKNHSRSTASTLTGVPESTLKKFELSGQVSLRQFLQLCHVYGDLAKAEALFNAEKPVSMDAFLNAENAPAKRQRGRS